MHHSLCSSFCYSSLSLSLLLAPSSFFSNFDFFFNCFCRSFFFCLFRLFFIVSYSAARNFSFLCPRNSSRIF